MILVFNYVSTMSYEREDSYLISFLFFLFIYLFVDLLKYLLIQVLQTEAAKRRAVWSNKSHDPVHL